MLERTSYRVLHPRNCVNQHSIYQYIYSFEGYVMDFYCIDRGTLLDNPNVNTLEGPDQHSVHWYVYFNWGTLCP